jgi:hypothetical protein
MVVTLLDGYAISLYKKHIRKKVLCLEHAHTHTHTDTHTHTLHITLRATLDGYIWCVALVEKYMRSSDALRDTSLY